MQLSYQDMYLSAFKRNLGAINLLHIVIMHFEVDLKVLIFWMKICLDFPQQTLIVLTWGITFTLASILKNQHTKKDLPLNKDMVKN